MSRGGIVVAVLIGVAALVALLLLGGRLSAQRPAAVVLHYSVTGVQSDSLLARATAIAAEPHVARVRMAGEGKSSKGVLVFASLEDYASWRERRMAGFFNGFGPGATVESVRILRPDQIEKSQAMDLLGIGDVNIQYRNADNEAEGDADIDAVTVICADGAECEPSN